MDEGPHDVPTRNPRGALDRRFLELLACPLTKGPLRLDEARSELVSASAGLAYPVRDGIPILLISEARRLADPGPSGQ